MSDKLQFVECYIDSDRLKFIRRTGGRAEEVELQFVVECVEARQTEVCRTLSVNGKANIHDGCDGFLKGRGIVHARVGYIV